MDFEMDTAFVPRLRADFKMEPAADGGLKLTSQCRMFTLAPGLPTRLATAMDGRRTTAEILSATSDVDDLRKARNMIEAWWKRGLIEDLDSVAAAPALRPVSALVRPRSREA